MSKQKIYLADNTKGAEAIAEVYTQEQAEAMKRFGLKVVDYEEYRRIELMLQELPSDDVMWWEADDND